MSCDSASPNRVAEEVYPTLWCWISFLPKKSIIYLLNANCIPHETTCRATRSGWTDNKIKIILENDTKFLDQYYRGKYNPK